MACLIFHLNAILSLKGEKINKIDINAKADRPKEVRIIPEENHQWGDPSPGQLLSVAISVILIWAILTGYVPLENPNILLPLAGVWFLCTALYSFMSGVVQLRNGNSFTGTLQTFFGVFFFGGFGLTFLVGFFGQYFLNETIFGQLIVSHNGILPMTSLFPFVYIVLGTILLAFTVVVILLEKVVGVSLLVFVLGLYTQGVAAFMNMPHVAQFYGGWIIGIAGFILLYAGIAEVINEPLGKEVIPLP